MKQLIIVIATVFASGACTPIQEKQLDACKMQAIEKGFRDDQDYLTACMGAAGYREWFEERKQAELPSEGWGPARRLYPCPDNDPLGLFTDADCDPVKPKRKIILKATKCTPEQFYANLQQCM